MFNRRQILCATAGVLIAQPGISPAEARASMDKIASQAKAALMQHQAHIKHFDRIAVADFSLNSSRPRFHLIDIETGQTQSFLVAHGKGSDPSHTGYLRAFSNVPGSEATSEGAYLTADTYIGRHGVSRRLVGLDNENSNAYSRAIVMHSAWYVSDDMARAGKLGRSQGCFAFSVNDYASILESLGAGRLLLSTRIQG
ncbi:murein L,D-transpeptidase catalytic domain family protein [Asticcacaulis machinosus]|uniref:Murein L,D-transpeptidase catalytic domain family protein n=1 Tax=Asticcacaulis machinosus TaxID=2984211 RepID=A0ABT5HMN6_9CAUL|nr:murein L,D-transpeptidase catalytic domain family protein [Asticcacaulis machinosus]MDC7677509.1 murein L,D-transpeptidase catalytic domain family protein [Asticcacaulis machinosus]